MDPITLAALAFGGLFLTRGKKRRSSSGGVSKVQGSLVAGFVPWSKDEITDAERRIVLAEIRNMAQFVTERYGMMPGLSDYLTVVGFIESRFNPWAANPQIKTDPYNAARGPFGMRPKTAFKKANGLTHLRDYPFTLYSIRWSFVAAVDDIARAARATYEKGTGDADWAATRRWWGYPSKVHDFNYEDPYSAGNTERFEEGLHKCNDQFQTGIDPDFIWEKVRAENYPGIEYLMYDFGLNPSDPYGQNMQAVA